MIRHIPGFILEHYQQRDISGTFKGYALLFDVADFTPISTEFQKHGKAGAEELSNFLDFVFSEPISIVDHYGGFVSLFAGDAFCAIFPNGTPANIVSAVSAIGAYFSGGRSFQASIGSFPVKVRQTIVYGEINWQIYENDLQNENIFFGDTISELAKLTEAKGDTVFSAKAAVEIGIDRFKLSGDGYELLSLEVVAEAPPIVFKYSKNAVSSFINGRIAAVTPQNEIRSGAYCFANLEAIQHDERENAIAGIQKLTDRYGGFVNKYDATDKGLVALVLFGIPRSEGNTLERICRFALELVEEFPLMALGISCGNVFAGFTGGGTTDKGLVALVLFGIPRSEGNTLERICRFALELVEEFPLMALGISCGNVFAGFTGGGTTREYTALGHPVNLASRLMSIARSGEIITDSYLYQKLNGQFVFEARSAILLKGINTPIMSYRLRELADAIEVSFKHRFVGRDRELADLNQGLQQAILCRYNTAIYIHGDPGIGKSRLIQELLKPYAEDLFHRFSLFCDSILPRTLEPVKQMLRQYFPVVPKQHLQDRIADFRVKWSILANGDIELIRIESIIASLLGYEWEHSIWELLPPSEKPKQQKAAFLRFVAELAREKPVLIHIDDAQWIDARSREYMQALSNKEIKQVHIICSCRYNELGGKIELGLTKHANINIDLGILGEDGSNALIRYVLKRDELPQHTYQEINDRAGGNPFFIEQLCAYLQEIGKIDEQGRITCELGPIASFSISDIIGSRIDRLTDRVRDCVYNASVLGMEFNIEILSMMLNANLESDLAIGRSNLIWEAPGIFVSYPRQICTGRILNSKSAGKLAKGLGFRAS